MIKRRTYIILLFFMALVFSACSRDRRSCVRRIQMNEQELLSNKQANDSSHFEMWSQEAFDFLVPAMPSDVPSQILERIGYITSFNHETKCPNWVAWHLYRDRTSGPYRRDGVPYYDEDGAVYGIGPVNPETVRGNYIVDMEAQPIRQELSDWEDKLPNNSHGHICPAADNRWSKEAMNQSFLLTNICPQNEDLNRGDWAGLEDRCRTWARRYGDIFIVAGPIFYKHVTKTMGTNKVGVPDAFFKVILRCGKDPKAIGFVFPNEGTHHEITHYMLTVDEVEVMTKFDFFNGLPDETEVVVESSANLEEWKK